MLLNCHTAYSFCYGTLGIHDLLEAIQTNGYKSFVLTDINNTSACLETVRNAADYGLKPIIGIDFRNGVKQKYIGIARNNQGFKELNEHLTKHLHATKDFDDEAPDLHHSYIIYPLETYKGRPLRDNEFVGLSVNDILRLPFTPAKNIPNKLVALQPLTFLNKQHFNTHRLLRAIDKNTLLSKLDISEQSAKDATILGKDKLYEAYASFPQLINNTEHILSDCTIEFVYGKLANKNKKHFTDSVAHDMEFLRNESEKGLRYRYTTPSAEVLNRVEKELQVIGQMNFASYFLINWDMIRYARHKNYYYVGRGSGANSIIAYLLNITDVDPIDLDLYFERFINPFRTNAPDFDIDFSWTDRDDITRYIFEKYGLEHTALLGTYSTFQHDAVIRELGKVFGLPPHEIDKLQKEFQPIDVIYRKEKNAKSPNKNKEVERPKPSDETGRLIMRYSDLIKGLPSHLSIHASGIIISEEPVSCYTATSLPPKGYPTTQFSMLEAEDIGLYKFDILSQRGLGKIKDALGIIKSNKNADIDIHAVPKFKEDPEIKALLSKGKCIGCFYVESPAMRMLLAKLRADDYLRLVAASSIIRPGVAQSGMMREYILRYRDEKRREEARKALPELYNLLEETYGVMVYQEDVIKVAHFFAGLSLAEADYLRRGMSWKFKQRNEFHLVREKFFTNCKNKGYSEKTIGDIWHQIESFANFAFSKGHSASYAVESYQALYLKAHYPVEYIVATLNNGGGFYRIELYIHEARMHGAQIVPPCINNSERLCTLQDKTIYLGLNIISTLEKEVVERLLAERKNGIYADLYDFVKRMPISVEQLSLLIRSGAFSFTGKNKKELLWEAYMLINPGKKVETTKDLFDVVPTKYTLPQLYNSWLDDAFDEMELLGFSLRSPFDLLKNSLTTHLTTKELPSCINKTVEIVGYLVHIKNVPSSKGKMHFGTFIDLEGHWIDTVHFPPSASAYPFRGPGCYHIKGKVMEEFDYMSIEVQEMHRLDVMNRDTVDTPKRKAV
jgi:DNA polymerase-3 subunit alpha